MSFDSKGDGANIISTVYKLEIMRIELFSVYGVQSVISLEHFQDAEPDVLVHSATAIIQRFTEKGMKYNVALKAFCRKKGLNVENVLIGMDIPMYVNRRVDDKYNNIPDRGSGDDILFDNDHFEGRVSDVLDILADSGMSDNNDWVHPVYFAKCLTKVVKS